MKMNEANALIRDAKATERKMGTTFYKVVVDPNTGERTVQPVWQHGMPGSFGSNGFGADETISILTGIGSIGALYKALELNEKSKIGGRKRKEKQRNQAIVLGLISMVGFGSLMPLTYQLNGTKTNGA